MHTGFWWGNLKEGNHLEDLGMDGERRDAYRVLVGKPERRKPLGRQRHRCMIILKRILNKWESVGRIELMLGTSGGLW
jgi:hypothetical protein